MTPETQPETRVGSGMKMYQIVSAKDGVRSPPLLAKSLKDLAETLAPTVVDRPELANDYVLILMEDVDGSPYASRAPLMRIDTIIALHKEVMEKTK